MKKLQISRRLKTAAGLVGRGLVLADVGCDHAYLSIYLLETGRIPRAIAMDVNQGPLEHAKKHIQEQGLSAYIETRLSDGLKALEPGEAQSIVLAGMGGPLMERILTEGKRAAEQAEELILQPQSEVGRFRRFLLEQGYGIIAEDMVKEEGKFYPMMKAIKQQQRYSSHAEYLYGRELLLAKHPVLLEFLRKEEKTAEAVQEALKSAGTPAARERLAKLEQESRDRKEALAYYEM